MALGVEVQKKLIALFGVDTYDVVAYDEDGIPSATGTEAPKVICNDTSASFKRDEGHSNEFCIKDWTYDVTLQFKSEVDFADTLMSIDLSNLNFDYKNETILIDVSISNNVNISQPVKHGRHSGTELRFNIVVNSRR
jgi:hypothetical protein